MKRVSFDRCVVLLLGLQQLLYGIPASAMTNVQAGISFDAAALSQARSARLASGATPDLFRGDARMVLPIAIPPGTGGFTPSISLSYSSQGDPDGSLGVGWSLSLGAPLSIQRSTRDGAPEYDATDGFELDGQRLRATAVANRFLTENFDHSRIEWIPAGQYWRVLRPDGTRFYYGFHHGQGAPANLSRLDSAQVMSVAPTRSSCPDATLTFECSAKEEVISAGIPFAWYLDRMEDSNGNVIRVQWSDLGDPGMRYPTEVRYTEHVSGSVIEVPNFGGPHDGSLSKMRTVAFLYEGRPDVLSKFRSGFRRETGHRLVGIRAAVDGALFRRYVLAYEPEQSPASGRSRLMEIAEVGSDDDLSSARAHTFTYGNGGTAGWTTQDPAFALPDGVTLGVEQFTGLPSGVRILDVNSDGFPDVVQGFDPVSGIGLTRIATYLGGPEDLGGPEGFDTEPSPEWALPVPIVNVSANAGVVFGDFTGDGRFDVLRRQRRKDGNNGNQADPPNPGCSAGASIELENGVLERGAWKNTGTGWAVDPSNDFAPFPISAELVGGHSSGSNPFPFSQSCPVDALPFSSEFTNPVVLADRRAFDTGIRVVDANGDGRDDLVYKRELINVGWESVGFAPGGYLPVVTKDFRSGVLLNSDIGLAGGTFSVSHVSQSFEDLFGGDATFGQNYDRPRWQFPQEFAGISSANLYNWSAIGHCDAPRGNLTFLAFSGAERFVDVNADGLLDVLEHATTDAFGAPLAVGMMNNGYNWQLPETPRDGLANPPEVLVEATSPEVTINKNNPTNAHDATCLSDGGGGIDPGWRFVDVNGDGMADMVGGPGREVRLWDATGSSGSLWRPAAGWSLPAEIDFSVTEAATVAFRLGDVNGDGMMDILTDGGAYLNVAEPPDRLESVTTPAGAVTTLSYAPAVSFEVPPRQNPTTADGQRRLGQPLWVLSESSTDPGPDFGQPLIRTQFAYFGPIYDEADRGFRGFQRAEVMDANPDGAMRRARQAFFFHTSDALAGQIARVETRDDATGDLFRVSAFEYTSASGADGSVTLTRADFSVETLATGEPAASGFSEFFTAMTGSASAASAHMAFAAASEDQIYEGQGQPLISRTEREFDFYGNLSREIRLGDPGDPDDDVEVALSYSIRDTDALLLSRLSSLRRSGASGPSGTSKSRTIFFVHDGGSLLKRGNLNEIAQLEIVDDLIVGTVIGRSVDPYGNVVSESPSESIGGAPSPDADTVVSYDPAYQTFPISIARADGAPEALETTFEYGLPGCGAPLGFGAVCRMTDPNGQPTAMKYDGFGREIRRDAPNGFAQTIDYHPESLGTAEQRLELLVRWDASAGDPATDPEAIRAEMFFDGLERPIRRTRSGLGSRVEEQLLAYDGAGRVARLDDWAVDTAGVRPFALLAYDGLGRLLRQEEAEGSVTQRTYRPREVEIQEILPADGVVSRRIERSDAFGRLAAVEEFENPSGPGAVTTYGYDPFDNLTSVENAVANDAALCGPDPACSGQQHTTEILYDKLGNRISLSDPDAGVWQWDYDARGRVIVEADPRGILITNEYDELDRPIRKWSQQGTQEPQLEQSFVYGLAESAPPNGIGRLLIAEDAEGRDAFDYDAAGNVRFHRRTQSARRFDFVHAYDPLGRRISTTYPDGEQVQWRHDKRHLVGIDTTGGSFVGSYVASADYDARGNATALELGGSGSSAPLRTTRTFDNATGRLERLQAVTGAGVTVMDFDYQIDGLGRVRELAARATPAATTTSELRTFAFAYDGLHRLTQASGPFGTDPALVEQRVYGYDALGNLRQKGAGGIGGLAELRYGHPTKPHAMTQAFDAQGQLQVQYGYDTSGNVTQLGRRTGTSFTTTTLDYDAFGRTARVGSETMAYSALGERVRLTSDGLELLFPEPGFEYLVGEGRVNKHFFVGGLRVASSATTWTAPSAASSPLLAWRGPQLSPPPRWALATGYAFGVALLFGLALRPRRAGAAVLVRSTAAGLLATAMPALIASDCTPSPAILGTHDFTVMFYATDHLGSTIVTVSGSLNVQMRRGYEPFGEVGWGEGSELGHQFTGERMDPTGLYVLGPRQYDPTTGRFLQPDPIVPGAENPQALNRYSYVLNRPLEFADPSGLQPESSSSQGRRPSIGPGFFSNGPGIIGRIPGFEHIGLLFRLLSGEFPRGASISERRFQSVPQSQGGFASGDLVQQIPAPLRDAVGDRLGEFRDFVLENGAATLTVSGALNRKTGVGAAVSISTSDFDQFQIEVTGGVGIGFGSSITGSLGAGSSGDVGLSLVVTGAAQRLAKPGFFLSGRVGEFTLGGAVGAGIGDGSGVVLGFSSPPFTVTRDQLLGPFR